MMRLSPKMETLRALFANSGNQCAFPGCIQRLINSKKILLVKFAILKRQMRVEKDLILKVQMRKDAVMKTFYFYVMNTTLKQMMFQFIQLIYLKNINLIMNQNSRVQII